MKINTIDIKHKLKAISEKYSGLKQVNNISDIDKLIYLK